MNSSTIRLVISAAATAAAATAAPLCQSATLPFFSTSDPSAWQVATTVGGVDGDFSSFPTTGFVPAVAVTGRETDGIGWIANNTTGTNACCVGTWTFFVFRQSFDLTGYDPASASLQFQWAADDSGEGILDRGAWRPKFSLNGGALIDGNWPTGSTYGFSPLTAVSDGFIDGINTITFYVEGNGITDGFALRELGLTAQVPEPATWALWAAGLALAMVRQRHVHRRAA
jgi:hypothetical protein